jgi:hypothetical protein
MKLLKIRVRADAFGGMIYPEGFLSFSCLEYIYCDELETGICWLVVLISDENFDKITDKTDVEEIDVAKAEEFLDKYDLRKTEVTDEARIRAIEIKTAAVVPLSAEDLKALDPADSTPGIKYRKRFIDKAKIRMGLWVW